MTSRAYFIGLLICIATYSGLHLWLFQNKPLIGDDCLASTLTKKMKVPLSFTKLQNESDTETKWQHDHSSPKYYYGDSEKILFPLWHQYRQGGFPLYLIRILKNIFSPKQAVLFYHWLLGILAIIGGWLLLPKILPHYWSILTLFFFSADAHRFFSYPVGLSEPFLFPLTFFSFWLLTKEKIKYNFLAGLLLGLSFYVKVTTLYYLFSFLPFFWRSFLNKQKLKSFLLGFLPVAIPLLYFYLSFGTEETAAPLTAFSPELLFQDLFKFIGDREAHWALIMDELYYPRLRQDIWHSTKITFTSILLWGLLFFNLIGGKRGLCLKAFGSMGIFTILMVFTLPNGFFNPEYMGGMLLFISILTARSLLDIHKLIRKRITNKNVLTIIGVWLLLPWAWDNGAMMFNYVKKGPITVYDGNLAKEIVDTIEIHPQFKLYTLADEDQSRYEYFSEEKLKPIHLFQAIHNEKPRTLEQILHALGRGQLIFNTLDAYSYWWWTVEYEKDFTRFEETLKRQGITTWKYQTFGKHSDGSPKAISFYFSKSRDVAQSLLDFPHESY